MEQTNSEAKAPRTPDECAALRARAEDARARAHDVILRSVTLNDKAKRQRLRHQEQFEPIAALRHDVRDAVADYASTLRRLEILPESAVIPVKNLFEESACAPLTRDVIELRQDIVGWAIEAYFAA